MPLIYIRVREYTPGCWFKMRKIIYKSFKISYFNELVKRYWDDIAPSLSIGERPWLTWLANFHYVAFQTPPCGGSNETRWGGSSLGFTLIIIKALNYQLIKNSEIYSNCGENRGLLNSEFGFCYTTISNSWFVLQPWLRYHLISVMNVV